jgi:pyruvate-formate lyase-activating enzyme
MTIETYSHADSGGYLAKKLNASANFDTSDIRPPLPKNALIELSNWCNHACVFCTNPRMVRDKGFLSLDLYKKFVDQAVEMGLSEIGLYTTGEPFFVKDLVKYVQIAKDSGVSYVYITTNGALATMDKVKPLLEAGLSSLKFSVNAGTRQTYQLVHGKDDFNKVIENIRAISKYRKENSLDLKLMASCVVTKYVDKEIQIIKDLLGPLIDEIVFIGVGGQGGQSLDQLALLESNMSDAPPKLGEAKPCSMLWNRIHVTREGYLNLCCIDYENVLTYADLNTMSLKEAWHNQIITEMRQRQLDQKLEGTLCHNCLYNVKDKFEPISNIGLNNKAGHESNNPAGIDDVANRIKQLEKNHSV